MSAHSSPWARVRRTVAELGWLNSILYALGKTVAGDRFSVRRYYFVAQPVPPAPLLPPHRGRNLAVRRIDPGDPAMAAMARPAEVIRARYAQGAVCFGAFDDERLAGYLWLTHGAYDEDEVHCRFVPEPAGEAAWDFDVHVDEAYRMGPAFARLWDAANEYFRACGVRWTLSRISAFNAASFASHRRLGARFLGSGVFLGGPGWQLMLATVRPFAHLTLGAGSVPVIRLSAAAAAQATDAKASGK